MSSWPTWTPSAPQAAARSGRSLSTKSAPAAWQRSRAMLGGGQQLVVGGVLVAQLEEVDAAGQRAVQGARHPAAVGDEVQAGVAQARSAVHAHSLASHARYHRWSTGARSFGLRGRHHGRRPSGADPGHAGEARGARHSPSDRQRQLRRSRRRRRHRRPRRRLARARSAGCASSCSTAASSARGPRTSPPACSRRSPRPTSASARCSSSGLRSARALAGLRRASWPRSAGVDVGYRDAAAR